MHLSELQEEVAADSAGLSVSKLTEIMLPWGADKADDGHKKVPSPSQGVLSKPVNNEVFVTSTTE